MEQEVRAILQRAVSSKLAQNSFAQKIQQHFAGLDVDELPIPERKTLCMSPALKGQT
jgi:hypothetical protein